MLTSICYMGFKNNNGLLLYSKNSLIKFEIGDDHIPRQKSHPSQKYPDGTYRDEKRTISNSLLNSTKMLRDDDSFSES